MHHPGMQKENLVLGGAGNTSLKAGFKRDPNLVPIGQSIDARRLPSIL